MEKPKDKNTVRLAALLLLAAGLSFALAIFRSAEHPDIYYYMGCVRLVLEGKVPFVDFYTHYTPFTFYMSSLPAYFIGTDSTAALSIETFMSIINALLIYRLLREEVRDRALCLFAVAFYATSLFFIDGMCYVLEPFVMFWGLLSLIAVRKGSLWAVPAAGACCFLAFWSKQYGLGFFALDILYLLLSFRTDLKALAGRLSLLSIGFAAGACCAVGPLLMQGATLSDMTALSGDTYEKFGLPALLEGIGYLLLVAPFMPIAAFLVAKHFKILSRDTFLVVCFFGIVCFMVATYVRPYLHYIQLPLPFAIFLTTILLDRYGGERLKRWFKVSVIVPLSIMVVIDYNFIVHNERQDVADVAAEVAKLIPEGTDKVYVSTRLLCVAHVNRYGAPMLWKHGMKNGFMEEGEPLRDNIMDAGCYVIDPVKLEYLRREEPQLLRHIEEGRHATRIDCRDKRFVAIVYTTQ